MRYKPRDISNQKFGRLLAIKFSHKENKRPIWECLCDCGNTCYISCVSLTSNNTKSCGCLKKDTSKANTFKDETGNKYFYLTVIKFSHSEKNMAHWKCQCDCGNIGVYSGVDLRHGRKKSCGCYTYRKEVMLKFNKAKFIDLTGKQFGKLTVLEYLGRNNRKQSVWKCRCECGTVTTVEYTNLTKKVDYEISCGCLISKGEEKIGKILVDNNIPYKKQYSFPDLKFKQRLRFDFAVLDNDNTLKYLIEYDGAYHFNNISRKENLELTKLRDNLKNEYCINNNIPLIRINYMDYCDLSIDDLILEKSKFLINK